MGYKFPTTSPRSKKVSLGRGGATFYHPEKVLYIWDGRGILLLIIQTQCSFRVSDFRVGLYSKLRVCYSPGAGLLNMGKLPR